MTGILIRCNHVSEEKKELQYVDTDSNVFPFEQRKSLFEDLTKSKEELGPIDLAPSCELYSKDDEKLVGKRKLETAAE